MAQSKHHDVTAQLAIQALAGVRDSINTRPAFARAAAKFQSANLESATKRRRIILLNLNDSSEAAFWQTLHNLPEFFTIISEKESHQRGEYVVRVIFYELGDELPVVKTKEQFLEQYSDAEY